MVAQIKCCRRLDGDDANQAGQSVLEKRHETQHLINSLACIFPTNGRAVTECSGHQGQTSRVMAPTFDTPVDVALPPAIASLLERLRRLYAKGYGSYSCRGPQRGEQAILADLACERQTEAAAFGLRLMLLPVLVSRWITPRCRSPRSARTRPSPYDQTLGCSQKLARRSTPHVLSRDRPSRVAPGVSKRHQIILDPVKDI